MGLNDSSKLESLSIFFDSSGKRDLSSINPALVDFLESRPRSGKDYIPADPFRLSITKKIENIDFLNKTDARYYCIYNTAAKSYSHCDLSEWSCFDRITRVPNVRSSIQKYPYVIEVLPASRKSGDAYKTVNLVFHLVPPDELSKLITKIENDEKNDLTQSTQAIKKLSSFLKL